jgi:hypothetical protein
MRLDWDMKAIQKKMVMSATYRQSSGVSPELLERDRFNRMLARGPRVRLDAEMVRDQMLAASGLLSKKMYGAPVMPLQPDGVWQVVYSNDRWETSSGVDRYRRALYTMWRRTSPPPAAMVFDAPTGEVCTLRRIRTNTPLQALVTLNDPLALEAAQHLAQRVLRETGRSFAERIRYAFRLCLMRPPEEAEVSRLRNLYNKAKRNLKRDRQAGRELLHVDRIIYRSDREETLIATSKQKPGLWRYRLKQPPEGWRGLDFEDDSWKQAPAIFGHIPKRKKKEKKEKEEDDEDDEKYKLEITTRWDTERIWLRRTFEVPESGMEDLRVEVNFRGGFDLYLNGILAAQSGEDDSGEKEIELYPPARKAVRAGRNVLAVLARRDREGAGRQYIDVGLTAARPPAFETRRSGDAERAAWVVLSHVLLNLDELLTKR